MVLKRGKIAFRDKKNNSSISEKPPNLVEIEEKNRYRKSQVCLGFLFPIVDQSLLRPVVSRVTSFAIYHCGQSYIWKTLPNYI